MADSRQVGGLEVIAVFTLPPNLFFRSSVSTLASDLCIILPAVPLLHGEVAREKGYRSTDPYILSPTVA